MKNIQILEEPTELYKILKFESLVASGGEAKMVIDDGQVMVNNEVEIRRRKKIIAGDIIDFMDQKFKVVLRS
ncbi:RNA-binding S4 domain-containing protein [Neptunicella sp. SCSIO 80796]|uniref:RNA-binding S4 domain-containing protein n=1 Tax=Neptunicella plasticusilytica TaxID=3117012 RepID=UPI003A4D39A6